MNIEQAKKNVEVAKYDLEVAKHDLEVTERFRGEAKATLEAAESILLDIIANEPTEDKVIDMSHFIDSGLIMRFNDYTDSIGSLGYLQNILGRGGHKYRNSNHSLYKYCSPIFNHDYASMDGWDTPPIPEGYVINFLHYDGQCGDKCCDYNDMVWEDVRIFRIVAIKDGCKH